MHFPPPWHNKYFGGSIIDVDDMAAYEWTPVYWDDVRYPQPDDACVAGENGNYRCSGASRTGGRCDWNSNGTYIPEDQEPTLPREMFRSSGRKGYKWLLEARHPWAAPGTAEIFGGGCGVNGGNPHGCWEGDPYSYVHCCTQNVNTNTPLPPADKRRHTTYNYRRVAMLIMHMVNLEWNMLPMVCSWMQLSHGGNVESSPQLSLCHTHIIGVCTGMGKIVVPRLRECRLLAPSCRGARVHAT